MLLAAAANFFHCENLYRDDAAEYYLVSDYNIKCWTAEHASWAVGAGLPIIFIVGILVPEIILNHLFKNREKLAD